MIPDLATVGGLASDPWVEKLAEIRLVVFLASVFSLSDNDSSDAQSLMVGTMIKVSLRVKSGPREFFMGPMGAEMTGRFRLPLKTLAGVGSRSREEALFSKPARMASIVVIVY
jgi:hypothetical protein